MNDTPPAQSVRTSVSKIDKTLSTSTVILTTPQDIPPEVVKLPGVTFTLVPPKEKS